jgi:hypothetical protein
LSYRLISILNSYQKIVPTFNSHKILIRPPQTQYSSQACIESRTLYILHHSLTVYSQLYRIQGDIIREIYNHNVISAQPLRLDELFSKILHLDHTLTRWKRKLHPDSALLPHDSIEDIDLENWPYTKIQTVLTLRFLNVRVLLFRKVLEHSLGQVGKPGDPPIEMDCSLPIGKTMIQACTDSCVQTITIIRSVGARSELLPAWWYTAYYGVYEHESTKKRLLIGETVFNSALILFGVICLQVLEDTDVQKRPATELVACLQTGLEALEVVGKETRIVRRCSKYLKKIIQVSTQLGERITSIHRGSKNLTSPAVRNNASARQVPEDTATSLNLLPDKTVPSISDESTHSQLQTEFGQFMVDEDYSFLDAWSGLVQESTMNLPSLEPAPHRQRWNNSRRTSDTMNYTY